jgi:putative ubiquitin-RnfH superfamily antitoxin RatB of RatAB toxin-antitoxin module
MSEAIEKMSIEVLYALPQRQDLVKLKLPLGTTVTQAVEASGLLQKHPDIELGKRNKLGVFGKLVKGDQVLRDQDRVEIYRPLLADPKEVRRKRAEEGKVMRKGGGGLEIGAAPEA